MTTTATTAIARSTTPLVLDDQTTDFALLQTYINAVAVYIYVDVYTAVCG